MKIVIIGDGKVGFKLAKQLSEENYDIVLIDPNEGKLKETINRLDMESVQRCRSRRMYPTQIW